MDDSKKSRTDAIAGSSTEWNVSVRMPSDAILREEALGLKELRIGEMLRIPVQLVRDQ